MRKFFHLVLLACVIAWALNPALDAQTNDCTADPTPSLIQALVCTGSCGSDCIEREFESPKDYFHKACSCFTDSEPTCCHLVIKLTAAGGQPMGFGVKGACQNCVGLGGRCKVDNQIAQGGDAQAVCEPTALPQ